MLTLICRNGTVNAYYRAIANGYSTDLESVFGDFVFYNGRTTVPDPYVGMIFALKYFIYI